MTRDQLIYQVQTDLDDIPGIFYTGSDLVNAIQDGYDEVALLSECIEKRVDVDFQSDKIFYDFSTIIPDYFRLFAIYNNNTQRWMTPMSPLWMEEKHPQWELAHGQSYMFIPHGFKHVALFPHLATGVGNMTVFYAAQAEQLVDPTSEPTIPYSYDDVLQFFVKMALYEQSNEYQKALFAFSKYEEHLGKLTDYMDSRQLPDRIMSLRG